MWRSVLPARLHCSEDGGRTWGNNSFGLKNRDQVCGVGVGRGFASDGSLVGSR